MLMRSRSVPLLPLSPRQQLRAGRLPRRLTQLVVGLMLYGASMAMMIRGQLGQDPWDVFHYGVAAHVSLSIGTVVILTGVAVLLAWIPLRQWPGLGTVANAVLIGVATDLTLAVLVTPGPLVGRIAMQLGGIALNGFASALYIGSQLGPGPRDGLMTGLARRTGLSIRLVRTSIELTVVLARRCRCRSVRTPARVARCPLLLFRPLRERPTWGDVVLGRHHQQQRAAQLCGGGDRPVQRNTRDPAGAHLVAERRSHDRLVAHLGAGRRDGGQRAGRTHHGDLVRSTTQQCARGVAQPVPGELGDLHRARGTQHHR